MEMVISAKSPFMFFMGGYCCSIGMAPSSPRGVTVAGLARAGPASLGDQGYQECLAGPSAQSRPSCHSLEDPGDLRQEESEKGDQETQVIRKEEISVMVNNRNTHI